MYQYPIIKMAVWLFVIIAIFGSVGADKPSVAYDGRSFIIDGARELLLSGGMHYNRVPRADWDGVMKMAKELGKAMGRKPWHCPSLDTCPNLLILLLTPGLNTIQTYFMWNFHEHEQGNITWEGQVCCVLGSRLMIGSCCSLRTY
jgi:beta-galactosidase GanA